jgi:hypothetical protein
MAICRALGWQGKQTDRWQTMTTDKFFAVHNYNHINRDARSHLESTNVFVWKLQHRKLHERSLFLYKKGYILGCCDPLTRLELFRPQALFLIFHCMDNLSCLPRAPLELIKVAVFWISIVVFYFAIVMTWLKKVKEEKIQNGIVRTSL